jgi:hypothetical protein
MAGDASGMSKKLLFEDVFESLNFSPFEQRIRRPDRVVSGGYPFLSPVNTQWRCASEIAICQVIRPGPTALDLP